MSTLYLKYRPQTWGAVVGQEHIKQILMYEVRSGAVAHAYLFSGPRGIGKTTTARLLAKAMNCQALTATSDPCDECASCRTISEAKTLDVIELDAASHRGIDVVREDIIENARFAPSQLRYKVFIIDEVHMLTTEAFNALLKTLEEPPSHAIFILATTEFHKVPATIVSRCQRFDFKRIPFDAIVERLRTMAIDEGCDVDDAVFADIARYADGGLRDAEGLLGKVLSVSDDKKISFAQAAMVLPHTNVVKVAECVAQLIEYHASPALLTIQDCVESGVAMNEFTQQIIEMVRKIMLVHVVGNADAFVNEMDNVAHTQLVALAAVRTSSELTRMLEILLGKQKIMAYTSPDYLALELAVIEICEGQSQKESTEVKKVDRVAAQTPQVVPVADNVVAVPEAIMPSAVIVDTVVTHIATTDTLVTSEVAVQPHVAEEQTAPIISLERIRSLWTEFLRRADEVNHSLPFILSVGQPVAVDGRSVKVGFEFAFHCDKLQMVKNKTMLETVLRSLVANDQIQLEGVVLEKKSEIAHTDAVPSHAAAVTSPVDTSLEAMFGGKVVA